MEENCENLENTIEDRAYVSHLGSIGIQGVKTEVKFENKFNMKYFFF